MKTQTILLIAPLLLLGPGALAQSSSPEVFKRIETNINNAKANKADSVRNLGTINTNITEVSKAKSDVMADSQKLKEELAINAKTRGDIDKSLDVVKKAEDQETKSLDAETKKIAELQEHIKRIENQMALRQKNLDSIRAERERLETTQTDWKMRGEELTKINGEVQVREQRVLAEEKEWSTKKLRYEKDIERWNKSLETQEKIKKNLTALKNN